MYRARDAVENEEWIAAIEEASERLELGTEARSRAVDLFLTNAPESARSKRAVLAASVYVSALTTGEQRSQNAVADATGVSRLAIQNRWKDILESAGFDAPEW
ncbi:cyclin family protein [Halapricum hydrolyticum]|uniref:Transcription initiation factor IIB family protein n=1 Tax=Halapricum hydrolyticum TaxID=2979991 RepID=A0AAE3IDY8_9EURY|nr:transcription initiation factor IIB family protein [Halapricum hydrolyticum]MCU4717561.1 transcription initiation factor IIB family protein [Halapricum hydrolyticum]MCU4726725.1 transcription initiation factor IIB family protein [Halapricum hydrolyticum]